MKELIAFVCGVAVGAAIMMERIARKPFIVIERVSGDKKEEKPEVKPDNAGQEESPEAGNGGKATLAEEA